MYRELGTVGTVFGVRGGPYAGKAHHVAIDALPEEVRARLTRAVDRTGRPEAILSDVARGPFASLPAAGALAVAASAVAASVALVALALQGFGARDAPAQPAWLVTAYVALTIAVAAALVRLARARTGALARPGKHLLPLDVLEIAGGVVRVVPLGGVRGAAIEGGVRGRRGGPDALSLVLTFEDGVKYTFPVASEEQAERAYRQLEHAQGKLEELTLRTDDVQAALDADPFFTLRSEPTWGAPPEEATRRARAAAATRVIATVVAATLLGGAGWAVRNAASRRVVARQLAAERTIAEYRALEERQRAEDARREEERARAEAAGAQVRTPRGRPRLGPIPGSGVVPARDLSDDARRDRDARIDRVAGDVARRAATPAAAAYLASALVHASDAGDPQLRVRFVRTKSDEDARAAALDADDERMVIAALRVVLSEIVPASMLAVTECDCDPLPGPDVPLVTIAYAVHARSYVFDARFDGPKPAPAPFRLTMPAPPSPVTTVRDRSLFTITQSADARGDAATQGLAARAFDRLYDELYGALLAGPPRVPIADDVWRVFQ